MPAGVGLLISLTLYFARRSKYPKTSAARTRRSIIVDIWPGIVVITANSCAKLVHCGIASYGFAVFRLFLSQYPVR